MRRPCRDERRPIPRRHNWRRDVGRPAPAYRLADARVEGDIDIANAEAHGDDLCALLDQCETPVFVVDCSDLELLESQGMAMMLRVHRHAAEHGIEVVWDGFAPRHRRILEIAGLDHFVVLGERRTSTS
jgi:anti-anti-sigma factor